MNTSIYDFSCKDSSGNEVNLSDFRGKILLIVNTASKCGFTPQYDGLQSLQAQYDSKKFGYSTRSVDQIRNLVGKGASVLIGRSIWGSAKKEFLMQCKEDLI